MSTTFKQKNVVVAYSPIIAVQSDIFTPLDTATQLTAVLPLPRDAKPLPNIRKTRDETRECRGRYLIGRRVTSRLALWTLRFTDVSAQFVAGILALAQGAAAAASGTNEVQTLTITATGGTYKLRVTIGTDVQTSTDIAYNANAAAIQSALDTLSNLANGDIVVSGTGPFPLTGAGNLADLDILPIEVLTGSLTGGSASINTTTPGAGRFHQITHLDSDDVPKTTFVIGVEDDSDEPIEVYKGMCVNRVTLTGEVRGKISMDVEFCGSADVATLGSFDFASCQNQAAIYSNDCQLLINSVDRTADLRRFQYTYNQNLAISDDPFVFDDVDASRIERGQDAEDTLFNFQLYGTKAHAVYVAAKKADSEDPTIRAQAVLPVALRIGTASEYAKIIAAGAEFALQDTELGYAGEANRSVINVDAVPYSVGGAAPDRVEALLAQQSRFLVAP
jgi:hypothetical protein